MQFLHPFPLFLFSCCSLWWASFSNLSYCSQQPGLGGITPSCGFSCYTAMSNSTATQCAWCFTTISQPYNNGNSDCAFGATFPIGGVSCSAAVVNDCLSCTGSVSACNALATTDSLQNVFGLTATLIVAIVFSALSGVALLILIGVGVATCFSKGTVNGNVNANNAPQIVMVPRSAPYNYYGPVVGASAGSVASSDPAAPVKPNAANSAI